MPLESSSIEIYWGRLNFPCLLFRFPSSLVRLPWGWWIPWIHLHGNEFWGRDRVGWNKIADLQLAIIKGRCRVWRKLHSHLDPIKTKGRFSYVCHIFDNNLSHNRTQSHSQFRGHQLLPISCLPIWRRRTCTFSTKELGHLPIAGFPSSTWYKSC